MKRIIFFLALLSVSVFAQTPEIQSSNAHPREHRGFYNSVSIGFSYLSVNGVEKENEARYSARERRTESNETFGFTFPVMDFRFGTAISNLVAFYTVFNFSAYSGSNDYHYERYYRNYEQKEPYGYYDGVNGNEEIFAGDWYLDKEEKSSDNAFIFKTCVGFGVSIYPFVDVSSSMNGFFIGGSVGYSAEIILPTNTDVAEQWGGYGRHFEVEIGKDWWVNDHLSLGVGLSYGHTILYRENQIGDDNSITLNFRLTRG